MARKTKEEAELTRQRLIDTAQQLFWEKGVSRTSLADIAEAAGVTRGAIYWHFADKTALFNAMCERILPVFKALTQRLDQPQRAPAACRLWENACDVLNNLASHPHMRCTIGILNLRCEYVGEMSNVGVMDRTAMIERFDILEKTFACARDEGDLLPGIDVRQAANVYHATVRGLIDIWLMFPDRVHLEDEAQHVMLPFFRGTFRADSWYPKP